jgi:type II secretory pathway pseudopilin PulG
MTLIEIVVVVSLIAMVYAVAAPDLLLNDQAERKTRINRISEDIRSAYDLAVLTGKPHRMVFELKTGDYWLETTEAENFYLSADESERDQSENEEKDAATVFDEKFQEYEQLAGSEFTDPSDDSVIKPTSPLLRAKDALRSPEWKPVESGEWERRSIAPLLSFVSVQAEHHRVAQSLDTAGEEAKAMIYFFPQGYVEKALILINEPRSESDNSERPAIAIVTEPYEGSAEQIDNPEEIDVSRDAQKRT